MADAAVEQAKKDVGHATALTVNVATLLEMLKPASGNPLERSDWHSREDRRGRQRHKIARQPVLLQGDPPISERCEKGFAHWESAAIAMEAT